MSADDAKALLEDEGARNESDLALRTQTVQ
jgi:hypothetical protein